MAGLINYLQNLYADTHLIISMRIMKIAIVVSSFPLFDVGITQASVSTSSTAMTRTQRCLVKVDGLELFVATETNYGVKI